MEDGDEKMDFFFSAFRDTGKFDYMKKHKISGGFVL